MTKIRLSDIPIWRDDTGGSAVWVLYREWEWLYGGKFVEHLNEMLILMNDTDTDTNLVSELYYQYLSLR